MCAFLTDRDKFNLRPGCFARGFTLIEILIVMLIISIVGGASLMMITHNQNTRMETLAKELANLLTLAETEAMLKPAVLGFAHTADSFQFYEYQELTPPPENPWQPVQKSVLGLRRLPPKVQLSLTVEGRVIAVEKDRNKAQPTLIISTSGDITPFVISISNNGDAPRYQVIGAGDGSIHHVKIQ